MLILRHVFRQRRFVKLSHQLPRQLILAEVNPSNGELVEACVDESDNTYTLNEHVFNIKVKTKTGDGWLLGNAHSTIETDKVGVVGFLNTKRDTSWYGYVNVEGALTGYKFFLVNPPD